MDKIKALLKGRRTKIIAAAVIVLAVAQNFIYIPNWVFEILLGGGAITLRDAIDGIKKDSKQIIDNADKK